MEATEYVATYESKVHAQERLEEQLAELSAHMNAATARWLELALEFREAGGGAGDDLARWLAFRCGLSLREAREYVRVGESLAELPLLRAAFARGELTFTKVRALTRVATPASEEGLIELASVLTAFQLARALRAYRRVTAAQARDTHELEYLDYYWDECGSLVLRARLAAEDRTILVHALEAARERVRERRREERTAESSDPALQFEPPRPLNVEAVVELAQQALSAPAPEGDQLAHLLVHVDLDALSGDRPGRCELEEGPLISPETARRLGCDAETVSSIEQQGLPLSVCRTRRTVPVRLRRLLEARDEGRCRFPGCERRHHLDAPPPKALGQGRRDEPREPRPPLLPAPPARARGWVHHRRGRAGRASLPQPPRRPLPERPRSPPGSADELIARNTRSGLAITAKTNRNGYGDPFDLACAVDALLSVMRSPVASTFAEP